MFKSKYIKGIYRNFRLGVVVGSGPHLRLWLTLSDPCEIKLGQVLMAWQALSVIQADAVAPTTKATLESCESTDGGRLGAWPLTLLSGGLLQLCSVVGSTGCATSFAKGF